MEEKQITFTTHNHVLDNNDNFSSDDLFLCYDTRGTVYNEDIGNCQSIEKVNIATGEETVLWDPPSITGDRAAPGVGAVSYHPYEDKVIFIHGPNINEVKERGYYGKTNRTALEVAADGSRRHNLVEMRDVTHNPTPPGAHRGGTHRHEYCRDGSRIGFTYDDFLVRNIDRTIGYMEANPATPAGYTKFFAVILRPAEKGKARPGEIEKAYGDSWVDSAGTMRAFIGKVRREKGGYDEDLFVADIPKEVDITTAFPGTRDTYPAPPEGIVIRRLTRGLHVSGIVRGSCDGTRIAFAAADRAGIPQLFVIRADGSQRQPRQVTRLTHPVEALRWHPSGRWILFLSDGHLMAAWVGREQHPYGTLVQLTREKKERQQLVLSHDGTLAAYDLPTPTRNEKNEVVKDASGHDFRQIWVMRIDWEKVKAALPNEKKR